MSRPGPAGSPSARHLAGLPLNPLRRLVPRAAVFLLVTALAAPIACAELLVYKAFTGPIDFGAPGPGGSYTLGGITTPFSSAAVFTFTAVADSTNVVSGTDAVTGAPLFYNLVGTIAITMVDGATTRHFSAGTQVVGTTAFPLAAGSGNNADEGFSVIGFLGIDATNPLPTTAPGASILATGTAFYSNLASPGVFDPGGGFMIIRPSWQITNGTESGTLTFNKGGSDPLFTIAVAPVPELDPAGLGAALAVVAGAIGLLERRRSLDPE